MNDWIDQVVGELRLQRLVDVVPFFYSTQFLNSVIAAGTSIAQNITIQADSDFIAKYLTVSVYDSPNNALVTTLAPLTLSLLDTGSGRSLMDSAQSIQNIVGGAANANGGSGGSLPFKFPEPLILRASAQLQITITNLTSLTVGTGGRTFQRVDVSFSGYKVFKLKPNTPGAAWY